MCRVVLTFKDLPDKGDSVSAKLVLLYLYWLMMNVFTSKSEWKASSWKEKAYYSVIPPVNLEENNGKNNNPETECSATLRLQF